jgi:hypothetical protein
MPRAAVLLSGLLAAGVTLIAAPIAAEEARQKPKPDAEAGRFYVPNAGKTGTVTVLPGEELLRQPIRWGIAAKPGTAVRFPTSDGEAVIKAGETLPAVEISGLPGANGNSLAYCTNVPMLKEKGGGGGLMGALGSAIIRSLQDGRKCLLDKDGDGSADLAFLIDDGELSDRTPRPIAPVALNVAEMAEVGPGDYVAIEARKGSRPAFRIVIFQNGKHVNFHTLTTPDGRERRFQSVAKGATYPLTHRIYGARFDIVSHDPATGAMTIAWPAEAAADKVPVPSEIQYSYRYY